MTSTAHGAIRRSSSRHLGWRLAACMLGAALVGWLVYATLNILNPSQGDLQVHSDAVVSLAPQTHRLPTAQELVSSGVADTLVISYFEHDSLNFGSGDSSADMQLKAYCEAEAAYDIVCFTPEENATIGEAYAIAEMAGKQSWESLTVVTETTHAFRTRFILDSCLGGDYDLNVVVADRGHSAPEKAWRIVYENAALVKAAWQVAWRC